jgi:lysyl-tRNA synthetase class 1
MSDLREIAENANAWPFAEARALLKQLKGKVPEKGYVLFETGYGPSGLPHIGTFGEVARTTMVRHAFQILTDMPTKLFAFSDDMDGLRKVPENLPNQDMLAEYSEEKDADGVIRRNGSPLSSVPDPFGSYESFAHHNNERLRAFLDEFGFDYDFKSATDNYTSGAFDEVLVRCLEREADVRKVVTPTLGEIRRKTYCPFLPVVERYDDRLSLTRKQVLHHVVVKEARVADGIAVFQEVDPPTGEPVGEPFEHPVTGGNCKLQWRVDWAMRWAAFGVDYEMYGKDLIESAKLSGAICRILGGTPPAGFNYELFLDENGEKISKSRGNGLTMEEWLAYAPPESLALFMFQKPKTAKRLHFDVIPKNVDDYLSHLSAFADQDDAQKLANPVWHIHSGNPPAPQAALNYSILLNLAGVCGTEDKSVLWHFISRYRPDLTPENAPFIDGLVGTAIDYYRDFIKPGKVYRQPTDTERAAMAELAEALKGMDAKASAEDLQTEVYEVGKRHGFENLRDWFKALYEVLLGQSQGPRMGSFIALYGVEETVTLIERALAGEDLAASA